MCPRRLLTQTLPHLILPLDCVLAPTVEGRRGRVSGNKVRTSVRGLTVFTARVQGSGDSRCCRGVEVAIFILARRRLQFQRTMCTTCGHESYTNCVGFFYDLVTKSAGDLPTDSSSATLLQQSFCSLAVWHGCTALASHCNTEIVSLHLTIFSKCCR